MTCVVASPRAYLTSAATQGVIDDAAMTEATEDFVRPARARVRILEAPIEDEDIGN